MKLEMREVSGIVVVELDGEIDLGHSPALRKALMEILFEPRPLVIDLAQVAYIDSSGVAALVEAYQMAARANTRLVLAAPGPRVLRVLQLARLDSVFAIADTLDAALSA